MHAWKMAQSINWYMRNANNGIAMRAVDQTNWTALKQTIDTNKST